MTILSTLLTRFLGALELRQADVLFDAILPPDRSTGLPAPSAAGVSDFLQRVLALDEAHVPDAARWRALYRSGLAALDAAVQASDGVPLAELAPERAARLLTDLAAGRVAPVPAGFDQKGFFALLRDHCIQGCFADPRWGGNRGAMVWKWFCPGEVR